MGSSGKGGGGSGAAPPTAEYKEYLTQWTKDNTPKEKAKNTSFLTPEQIAESEALGVYAGTKKLDEAGYYNDKQTRQQKKLEEDMAKQQADLQATITKMTGEQNTLLTQQRAETEAAQKNAYRQNQQGTRDSLFMERQQAEAASVEYVNSQIAKEKSNASLYGLKYNMSDTDKYARISDYFGTIWSSDNENKLSGLMTEVGKPANFTDFSVRRGDGATLQKTEDSSAAKSAIVSVTNGGKGKTGGSTSLLDPEGREPLTTLLGG